MPGCTVSWRWSILSAPYSMKPSAALRPCPAGAPGRLVPLSRDWLVPGPAAPPGARVRRALAGRGAAVGGAAPLPGGCAGVAGALEQELADVRPHRLAGVDAAEDGLRDHRAALPRAAKVREL